jgi:hypothetical protein
VHKKLGRYVAQVVSCRPPTSAARFRAKVRSCGICGGQSCTGEGFLQVLRFPLPLIPPSAPHTSSSMAGTVGQIVSDVANRLSLTPLQWSKKKLLYYRDHRIYKRLKVIQTNSVALASELYRPSDRRLPAKLVPTFAVRGCHVVGVTDPYGRVLGSRPEPLLFLPSSSSIVLTKLSGPRSRPTTSQKIW